MWPNGFRLFEASPELTRTTWLARDLSRRDEDLPRLDLTSSCLPEPRTTFDRSLAQKAIGERFLSLLGALAISSNCAPAKVLIMPDDHSLTPDVRSGLAEYFGLTAEGKQFE